MSFLRSIVIVCVFAATAAVSQPQFEVSKTDGLRWFKGNTHTHTDMSDGDSPPEDVARWYKNRGYDFLVLSDHNIFVNPATLAAIQDSSFLLIPGEEVSSEFAKKPVHVNGLNIRAMVEPQYDTTLSGTIQKNVDAVRIVEGIPHINHPNFRWAIDKETLLNVHNYSLLEIYNGHPLVNNFGGGGFAGLEEVWDYLLSNGKRVYGIAVDDAHHFKEEFSADRSNPGRGWVMVRSPKLDADEIVRRLEAGEFYASTGVVLDDILIDARRITIHVQQRSDFKYRVDFIGRGGELLQRSESFPAQYNLKGNESYVRAKVSDSNGHVAWVQPVFVRH